MPLSTPIQLGALASSLVLSCFTYVSVVQATLLPGENVGVLAPETEQYFNFLSSSFGEDSLKEFAVPKLERNLFKNPSDSAIKLFFKEFRRKGRSPEEFVIFLDDLFKGVYSDQCKGHILEWMLRFNGEDETNIFAEEDKWVLQMIDSWGKIPEGILSGHLSSVGDYEECVEIDVNGLKVLNSEYSSVSTSFQGRYCTAYVSDYNSTMAASRQLEAEAEPEHLDNGAIKVLTGNGIKKAVSVEELLKMIFSSSPASPNGFMIPSFGICMPNSCSASEIHAFLTNAFYKLYEGIPNVNPKAMPYPLVAMCSEKAKPPLSTGDIAMISVLAIFVAVSMVAGVLDYYQQNKEDDKPSNYRNGKAYQYLMAFSFYNNTKKWLSTRKSRDDLGCLHGIRFLSTCWVVLGHTYALFGMGLQWNMVDAKKIYEAWTLLPILNGTFSVDTFFVMSGMLATFNILKMLDKTKGKFNVFMFYLHRYIRLTPTYAILLGMMATVVVYLGSGPNWIGVEMQAKLCRDNWWTNVLYINNIYKSKQMCNGESWYLANDMQFYILSPLIVYPLWKWKKSGLILLTLYTVLSIIAPVLVVKYGKNVPPTVIFSRDLPLGFGQIYIKPWSRIQTFIVGVWLGWLLHKTRERRVILPRIAVAVGWTLSTALALTLIYSIREWFNPSYEIPTVPGYFYAALSRFTWGLIVASMIFACIKGYGGAINKFLSWKVFMPLGRLTFCVYLTSFHLQMIFYSRLTVPIKYETYMMVNLFLAHMSTSLLVGYVCTVLFESPFIVLQKLIFDGPSSKSQLRHKREDTCNTIENKKRHLSSSKRDGIFLEQPDTLMNTQQHTRGEKMI